MTATDRFQDAQSRVKALAREPDREELLELYSLYKQATVGDCAGKRPGLLDLRGRAKYDAWQKRRGQTREACAEQYVSLVDRLVSRYGTR